MDRSLRIFDAHFHIIDPRFPLYPNQGFLPEPFTVEDYRARVAHLGVVGGAVVSASFQGSDQSHLVDALSRLGDGFVGVTQLPPTVTDAEIAALGDVGVRALRFNLYRGGSAGLEHLDRLARRVHEVAGWHVELYVDSADLPELGPRLKGLPGVVMDHLGLTSTGFDELLRLVEGGAWVKATGFGRVRLDVPDALRALYRRQSRGDRLRHGPALDPGPEAIRGLGHRPHPGVPGGGRGGESAGAERPSALRR
jgi:predicted TIM-barrel fold metal-dependent hydrolase